jgi:thiamine pyrophosphokinase
MNTSDESKRRRGLIIGNGAFDCENILEEEIASADFLISADGGLNYLAKKGIRPDLYVGDGDSLNASSKAYLQENSISRLDFPPEKDFGDMELSIREMIDRGYKEIILLCAVGSRWDHSLSNFFVLKKYEKKASIYVKNDKNTVRLVSSFTGEVRVKQASRYVSLIPIDLDGALVTLKGFRYELHAARLEFGSSLGISNHVVHAWGTVVVHRGAVLLIESED